MDKQSTAGDANLYVHGRARTMPMYICRCCMDGFSGNRSLTEHFCPPLTLGSRSLLDATDPFRTLIIDRHRCTSRPTCVFSPSLCVPGQDAPQHTRSANRARLWASSHQYTNLRQFGRYVWGSKRRELLSPVPGSTDACTDVRTKFRT
jgi:hypothetical protein